jgi:hypothetical protein
MTTFREGQVGAMGQIRREEKGTTTVKPSNLIDGLRLIDYYAVCPR